MLHGRCWTLFCVIAALTAPLLRSEAAGAEVTQEAGQPEARSVERMQPGDTQDVSGVWLYKPGYALSPGERPELAQTAQQGYFKVPVPQMLSRVRWWLDDSKLFDEWESARLKRLGFDTGRASDGWYRLWVDAPKDLSGRRVWVRFDGVAMKSEVFINGHRLGAHAGMFSRFGYDLTRYLKPGRNLLAVYVSMENLDPDQTPLGVAVSVNLTMSKIVSMDKAMFGPLSPVDDNRAYDLHGIWQPVSLHVTGSAKLDDVWFIPSLTAAEVRLTVSSAHRQPLFARVRWTDAKTGKLLHDSGLKPVSDTGTIKADGLKPQLWTPEKPHLYQMEVTLQDSAGHRLDVWRQKVGFRTFEVRGNRLYLNGRPYWLRGADQLPYGKNPWDPKLARELIGLAHEGNTTVTRTHCTPWNEAWLNTADEIGLGVSIEGMRPWALMGKVPGPPPAMIAHWKMENEDVVRRCRNHPSVLMYTVGNEMLLRDDRNVEKWKILSDVVKQTRALDPTRPVIANSGFNRQRAFYEKELRPAGVDDGDMDDLHSYRGWYAGSPFVQDTSWIAKQCDYIHTRPVIGQEISSGYPDLDTGLPVEKYIDLKVPQAWIGPDGERGGDPDVFLEHQRAVTKRLAEQLRYERKDLTAGFMLFSSETWFRNSYNPDTVKPYPVYEAVKMAFAPVGLALETPNRRFYAGSAFATAVFITNDQEDLAGPLTLRVELLDSDSRVLGGGAEASVAAVKYLQTLRVPVTVRIPAVSGRRKAVLRVRLLSGNREVSRTEDFVELSSRNWAEEPLKQVPSGAVATQSLVQALASELSAWPLDAGKENAPLPASARVVLTGGNDGTLEERMPALRRFAEAGGTVILLNTGVAAERIFPENIARSREVVGEYVDISAMPQKLRGPLEKMDAKWWARGDGRAFVISATHNLKGDTRALAAHIIVHGYVDPSKLADYNTSPLVEIPAGKGRFVLSEFDFTASLPWDPVARRLLAQLLVWAVE
ncbi:MAG: hypothetical protein IT209_09905 [Armatimonadetes bacterium]|nr:hypothetical protein [Armatimonadota bacterium]